MDALGLRIKRGRFKKERMWNLNEVACTGGLAVRVSTQRAAKMSGQMYRTTGQPRRTSR